MVATRDMQVVELNDVELVAESLGGNREAFCRIVEKYQVLICSLAYCALGEWAEARIWPKKPS